MHDHYNKTLEKLAEAEEAADAAENVDPKPYTLNPKPETLNRIP